MTATCCLAQTESYVKQMKSVEPKISHRSSRC